jgi:UDP-glucose 4-epimerase
VDGTDNTVRSAAEHNVEKFILLSTDKAVYPVNAMGMSKAMAEKVVRAAARSLPGGTLLNITRYGNVMASRGSVIPLFVGQAKRGEDITVTNPHMTRFMMSLEDAVDLVLYAFVHGAQGESFVQKAPACTVGDLAGVIADLFRSKSAVRYIGTRHGEKRHETLLTREELAGAEDTGAYYRIPPDGRTLDYDSFTVAVADERDGDREYTSENTRRLDKRELRELLLGIDYIKYQLAGDAEEKGLV